MMDRHSGLSSQCRYKFDLLIAELVCFAVQKNQAAERTVRCDQWHDQKGQQPIILKKLQTINARIRKDVPDHQRAPLVYRAVGKLQSVVHVGECFGFKAARGSCLEHAGPMVCEPHDSSGIRQVDQRCFQKGIEQFGRVVRRCDRHIDLVKHFQALTLAADLLGGLLLAPRLFVFFARSAADALDLREITVEQRNDKRKWQP